MFKNSLSQLLIVVVIIYYNSKARFAQNILHSNEYNNITCTVQDNTIPGLVGSVQKINNINAFTTTLDNALTSYTSAANGISATPTQSEADAYNTASTNLEIGTQIAGTWIKK